MSNVKEMLAQLPSAAFRQPTTGKFAAKLTRNERCAILALVNSGIKREVASKVFDIDKRTVAHIVNENGPHYKDIRTEYRNEGHDDFCAKYVTAEIMGRIEASIHTVIGEISAAAKAPRASAYAAKMRGIHAVQPEQCAYVHQIEIGYLEAESIEKADGTKYPEWNGWYYRDLTSEDKATWFHNGVESTQNSKVCFDMAVANLMDD
jgi:hypothetical protein